jgi:hypothetical protein
MNNYTQNRRSWLGPRPGDYPVGSIESRAAARAVLLAHDLEEQEQQAALLGNLTLLEQAWIERIDDPKSQAFAVYMFRNLIYPKHKMFGIPLPTREEVNHKRQLSEEKDTPGTESTRGLGVSGRGDTPGNG